jgi:hypothetical protein
MTVKKKIPEREKRKFHFDKRVNEILARDKGKGDELMPVETIAALWHLSIGWFDTGRKFGYGPPFIVIPPNKVRYPRADARAWLEQRIQLQTSKEYDGIRGASSSKYASNKTASNKATAGRPRKLAEA